MIKDFVDSSLDLGTLSLSGGSAAFSNVLDLGKTDADRMNVAVRCTASGVGGTSVILKLQGASAPDAETWTDILLTPSIALADITAGDLADIPIPPGNGYRALRLYGAVTGTFTAGMLAAQLDTYIGR